MTTRDAAAALPVTMQAVLCRRYGDADQLELAQVPVPSVGDREVLIRVEAVAVSNGDVRVLHGEPLLVRTAFGLRRPRQPILGRDVAGTVAAVGRLVTEFAVGDPVLTEANQGGWAEYVCVPGVFVAARPQVSAVDAASVVVSGQAALHALRLAPVGPGSRVLINGASGGVGSFAVQLAKRAGATVTGVCSGGKADAVIELGADVVLDYATADFVTTGPYDVIIDLVGNAALAPMRRALAASGTVVIVTAQGGRVFGPLGRILKVSLTAPFLRPRMKVLTSLRNGADLAELARLLASGELRAPVDGRFTLSEAADAVRYYESGAVTGKVVLVVG
ncbi:MAG TPA: NAD(P)-dependent alcohol dehydrogenase [Candidatus Lumbricidophila sp.]|nr:NAD(P)-dependent alcohol dehydrogenase [Candidatus Lumbricidophila sp.]